jgi:hypothetical protein
MRENGALGDYHPLTPIVWEHSGWAAWQYHLPDTGVGFMATN